ncbi:asparaginase [Candidatus Woesearchaeota archaeon]|nr:asparaginase [Candidatus Woesearchaeota archaeon]
MIKILITGGTIDNLDYASEKKAPKNNKSLVPKLLEQSRISQKYDVEMLMFKDSKFITDEDRKVILKKCRSCKENKIIITHGTMTMPKTAEFLGNKKLNKTIILVGSAIPAKKPNSDAIFNLGFAFAAAHLLQKGVYITMNGKIFSWNNVRKNLKTGFFETSKFH